MERTDLMERLKVLFITAWYPTKEQPVGGIFVREYAKAVQLYDDVVVLHCSGPDPSLKRLWRMERETDENLTEGIPTYRVWYRRSPIPKTSYFIYLWSVLRAFQQIVAQGFRPNIIHAHVYEAGVPAVLIGKMFRMPIVVTEYSSNFPRRMLSAKEILKARIAFTLSDKVCPLSQFLLNAIKSYRINASFEVVPCTINTQFFYPKKWKMRHHIKHLIYIAILAQPHKGLDYLLSALRRLRENRSDFHLHIVGDGPLRGHYENLVSNFNLKNHVTFHGRLPPEQIADLLRESDLFVLPSLFETFSVATAEALATGTPVLVTRCGGPEEFVTDNVGMLVSPGDAKALCEGLNYMLDHLDRFSPDQIALYASERFCPERVGEQLHTIYMACLIRHGN